MFFPESGIILDRHPHLREEIENLDRFMKEFSSGPFEAPQVAEMIGTETPILLRLLGIYVEEGLLQCEECVCCPVCETRLPLPENWDSPEGNPARVFCDICGNDVDVTTKDIEKRYQIAFQSPQARKDNGTGQLLAGSVTGHSMNEGFPQGFIDDVFQHTPIMSYLADKLSARDKPLAGIRAVVVLHFLRDLVPFTEAMINLGLDPSAAHFFYKHYRYPQRDTVATWLREKSTDVRDLDELDPFLLDLNKEQKETLGRVLVIEDGGYVVPLIHKKYQNVLDNTIGAVEQTMRGIWNDREVKNDGTDLKIPIASVAEAKLKGFFEPPHVAEAVIKNIESWIPDSTLAGMRVAVIGYGAIGKQVVAKLTGRGAKVTVYDTDSNRILEADNQGYNTADSALDAVSGVQLVVGCSGRGSLGRSEILALQHGAMLASASSELREFAIDELKHLSKDHRLFLAPDDRQAGTTFVLRKRNREVVLLADGYPVNFWGMNSMPDQVSDPIMCLLLLSAVAIATGLISEPGIDSDIVNALASEYEIAELYHDHYT